jgi:bacillithiol synthase
MHVSHLPFAEIPGQTRLFLEYLADPAALRRYYPNAVQHAIEVGGFIPEVLSRYRTDRSALTSTLERQNRATGGSDQTLKNIGLLSQDDCVTVVTGQQAGIFCGPVFTIYKALSAIRMADELRRRGHKAVPVFWIATEDHDFQEVSGTYFVGSDHRAFRTQYSPVGEVVGRPVGQIAFDDGIVEVLRSISAELPVTEFSTEMLHSLAEIWRPGSTFGEAFARTLHGLLGSYGLILLDPIDPEIKKLAAPIYNEAVELAPTIIRSLRDRSTELESAGYHAQVAVPKDYFPLFWHDARGRRLPLRREDDDVYRAKGDGSVFTRRDLAARTLTEPDRFSPGVMLRPVVQDFLLPSVCYYGGAAEIAYFAQNSEVYRVLDRPVTPILHRQSVSIVGPAQGRAFSKLGLKMSDLFSGKESLYVQVAETMGDRDLPPLFDGVEVNVGQELDRLQQALAALDPTLADNLATRRRKIIYHIAALRKKALLAEVRRNDTAKDRIDRLVEYLLPYGQLQERTINVFSFVTEFGPGIFDRVYDSIDVNSRDHILLDI